MSKFDINYGIEDGKFEIFHGVFQWGFRVPIDE